MSNSDQLVSAVRSLPVDQQAELVASIAGDIVRSNEGLRAEIERLTDILIACCNASGGQAVKGVSVDFLAHVPAEITGRIERLTREREEAVIRENDLANKYTAHPSHCPVTGRPFFMAIENESGEMVATYGGPFDSYTIPEWSVEDQEFRSERYDHDADYWVEGGEPYALLLVDEDEYNNLTAERDQLREQLEAAWKDSERRAFDKQYPPALECMRCEGLGCSLCKEDETV